MNHSLKSLFLFCSLCCSSKGSTKRIAFAIVLAISLLLTACASGPYRPRKLDLPKEHPLHILPVKNLSGVPLAKLDPDIYIADNMEHLGNLSSGKTLSFPKLLKNAMAVSLKDEGFTITDNPKERLHIHLAISEWSSADAKKSGQVWVRVDAMLVDQIDPEEPLKRVRSEGWHQLLEGNPSQDDILGTMRLISGAYQRIALDITTDLLVKAGVIDPPHEIPAPEK